MGTILEELCDMQGCQGGTIHQMKRDIKIIEASDRKIDFKFGKHTYMATARGLILRSTNGVLKPCISSKLEAWFREQFQAEERETFSFQMYDYKRGVNES